MTTSAPITFTDAGTFDSLYNKVRRWSFLPNAQNAWLPSDVLNTLDDENKNSLIELINALNEEFFVQSYIYTIPQQGFSGIIPIPSDAIGLDLRDVWASGGNTQPNVDTNWAPCRRVNPNQFNYPTSTFNWLGSVGPPYYVENNKIVFFIPQGLNISTGFTQIKLRYFKKPSTLCSRGNCAVITALNPTLNTITLDLSNLSSSNANSVESFLPYSTGMTFDFLQPVQPFPFDSYQITPISVVVASTFQTFTLSPSDTTTVNSLNVGDICCPTGTAPVLQYMPEEANAVLCQYVVRRMMDVQGNQSAYERADKKLQEYVAALQRLLTPKVADQTKVMVSQSDLFSTNASFTGSGNYSGGIGSR